MKTTRRNLLHIGDIMDHMSIIKHTTNHIHMSDSNYDNPIKYTTLSLMLRTRYINEVLEQKYVVLSVGAHKNLEEFLDISEAICKYNEIVNMVNEG